MRRQHVRSPLPVGDCCNAQERAVRRTPLHSDTESERSCGSAAADWQQQQQQQACLPAATGRQRSRSQGPVRGCCHVRLSRRAPSARARMRQINGIDESTYRLYTHNTTLSNNGMRWCQLSSDGALGLAATDPGAREREALPCTGVLFGPNGGLPSWSTAALLPQSPISPVSAACLAPT